MYSLDRNLLISDSLIFKRIIRSGRHEKGDRITVFWIPGETGELKIGFTTTRKIKNAVARNRARRLMKEVFRLHRSDLMNGVSIVLRWSGKVEGWNYRSAEAEILG